MLEEDAAMDLPQVFQSMINNSGARAVFGEPVISGEKTIIPVARISYGFGFGSGRRKPDDPEKGGGGGGFNAVPAGCIEIGAGESRFIPISDRKRLATAMLLGFVMGVVLARRPRRFRM
jgi:uncharacterized spore protein YtfJ